MDINDVKNEKSMIEKKIYSLIEAFEDGAGVEVVEIMLSRQVVVGEQRPLLFRVELDVRV